MVHRGRWGVLRRGGEDEWFLLGYLRWAPPRHNDSFEHDNFCDDLSDAHKHRHNQDLDHNSNFDNDLSHTNVCDFDSASGHA